MQQQFLSRDEKKALMVENIFLKMEEKEKKREIKQKLKQSLMKMKNATSSIVNSKFEQMLKEEKINSNNESINSFELVEFNNLEIKKILI